MYDYTFTSWILNMAEGEVFHTPKIGENAAEINSAFNGNISHIHWQLKAYHIYLRVLV